MRSAKKIHEELHLELPVHPIWIFTLSQVEQSQLIMEMQNLLQSWSRRLMSMALMPSMVSSTKMKLLLWCVKEMEDSLRGTHKDEDGGFRSTMWQSCTGDFIGPSINKRNE